MRGKGAGLAAAAGAATHQFVQAVYALALLVWIFLMHLGTHLARLLKFLMPFILRAICIAIWAGTGVVAFVQVRDLFDGFSPSLLATYAGVVAAVPAVLSIWFGLRHGFDLWALTIWSGMLEGFFAALAYVAPRTQGVFMIASGIYPLVLCVCMVYLVITHKEELQDARINPEYAATLGLADELDEQVSEPGI